MPQVNETQISPLSDTRWECLGCGEVSAVYSTDHGYYPVPACTLCGDPVDEIEDDEDDWEEEE